MRHFQYSQHLKHIDVDQTKCDFICHFVLSKLGNFLFLLSKLSRHRQWGDECCKRPSLAVAERVCAISTGATFAHVHFLKSTAH
jgi:hypothetical protein